MLIKYICDNCNKTKTLTKIKEDVICECGKRMKIKRRETSSEVMTTPETRFMGDEALFNTVGARVNNQHKSTGITKGI